MNRFFDEIVVINLERSTQRKSMVEEQLQKHNIKYHFFPAFDGKLINNPALKSLTRRPMKAFSFGKDARARFSVGALCCAISHSAAIKYAQMMNLNGILILEDDVILSPDFADRLKLLDEVPEDAQVIYLGAIAYEQKLNKKYQISEHIWDVSKMGFYGMHSYIITKAGYKPVLDKLMDFDDTCDGLLPEGIVEGKYKGYGLFPFCVYQIGGTSDIDGKSKSLNYTKTLYSPDSNFDNMCGYDRKTKTNIKDIKSEYSYEKTIKSKPLL
jgi:GR25 family glycosyltransferase involved in LPS biosynthesis